jgi:hypothetical protein
MTIREAIQNGLSGEDIQKLAKAMTMLKSAGYNQNKGRSSKSNVESNKASPPAVSERDQDRSNGNGHGGVPPQIRRNSEQPSQDAD